jgi:hypothetical protein
LPLQGAIFLNLPLKVADLKQSIGSEILYSRDKYWTYNMSSAPDDVTENETLVAQLGWAKSDKVAMYIPHDASS